MIFLYDLLATAVFVGIALMAKGGSDTFMYASAIFITINIAEAILWVRPNRETMKNVRFFFVVIYL